MGFQSQAEYLRARDALLRLASCDRPEARGLLGTLYALLGSDDAGDFDAMCAVTRRAEVVLDA